MSTWTLQAHVGGRPGLCKDSRETRHADRLMVQLTVGDAVKGPKNLTKVVPGVVNDGGSSCSVYIASGCRVYKIEVSCVVACTDDPGFWS
ncbi:hypothetical protein B296_00019363 [Ensete ventricosum]|uniref:Uncharacterized protein n=1 Tax=Ensete ventricosum TaxID=4639 RepID=A0A426ZJP2_ENSVE|nr:hypothetical protein B296_00019363 [Ensete ventricosum]